MKKPATNTDKLYEHVGPTAWRVAYFRAQSDIKYAAEIFYELDRVVTTTDPAVIEYMNSAKTSVLAPHFEARYKLINRLVKANDADQILELASGLTPRGLELTDNNPRLEYVELDLPEMVKDKQAILDRLYEQGQAQPRDNLHLAAGSALDQQSLFSAAKFFARRPITIVNEGLLRYLSFDQKAVVAHNVHAVLEKFGGAWVTSDITLKKVLTHEKERVDNRRRIKTIAGIDVEANCFESVGAAKSYFEGLGFSIESHGFDEVIDELASPNKIGIDKRAVLDMIRHAVVFVMRLD